MLINVRQPSVDYVLRRGEYVSVRFPSLSRIKGIIVRLDTDAVFLCATGNIFNGAAPSPDRIALICDALDVGYDAAISTWYLGDCTVNSGLRLRQCLQLIANTRTLPAAELTAIGVAGMRSEEEGEIRVDEDGVVIENDSNGFILNNYESGAIYTGRHSYHHSHCARFNAPRVRPRDGQHLIGVELEVVAKDCDRLHELTEIKSNWFQMESDSSLGSCGVEFITIPLYPHDAKSVSVWSSLTDYLVTRADSWNRSCCGLHVHIGREALGKDENQQQSTLGKLLYLYYGLRLKDADYNIRVYGRSRTYSEQMFECPEVDSLRCLGEELISSKKIQEKVDKGVKDAVSCSRYFDINVQNPHTIEFRKGKGSIKAERIVAVITYSEALIRYSRVTDWSKLSVNGLLQWLRKSVPASSPLHLYLSSDGE